MLHAWTFEGFFSVGRTPDEAVLKGYETIRSHLESIFEGSPSLQEVLLPDALPADATAAQRAEQIEKLARDAISKGTFFGIQCHVPADKPDFPADQVLFDALAGATSVPTSILATQEPVSEPPAPQAPVEEPPANGAPQQAPGAPEEHVGENGSSGEVFIPPITPEEPVNPQESLAEMRARLEAKAKQQEQIDEQAQ